MPWALDAGVPPTGMKLHPAPSLLPRLATANLGAPAPVPTHTRVILLSSTLNLQTRHPRTSEQLHHTTIRLSLSLSRARALSLSLGLSPSLPSSLPKAYTAIKELYSRRAQPQQSSASCRFRRNLCSALQAKPTNMQAATRAHQGGISGCSCRRSCRASCRASGAILDSSLNSHCPIIHSMPSFIFQGLSAYSAT